MAISATSGKNYQVQVIAGEHSFTVDEPKSAGGDNAGPSPYDVLLSALAACKIVTVQMYARRKKWPLDSVEVELSTHKEHAKDCEECESDPNARIDIIDVQIRITGDLDEEQLTRLTEISERCPVHRTLTSETIIRSKRID